MPESVITNIMDRLLLQEAVRTSILSRNWRYKWTLLSQLVFDFDFFNYLRESGDDVMHFDGKNISRLLLHLKELKHLKLRSCLSGPLPCFRGFPNLLSLDLCKVEIQDYRCGNLIVESPLLEILSITDFVARCEVKLPEIVKLENLKELNLSLCLLDNMTMTRPSDIFHQMSLLPRLQSLSLKFWKCKFLAEASTQTWVSTAFPCLKTLKLNQIDFTSDTMLSCVLEMLSGAPNLQTLEIMAAYENTIPPPLICSLEGEGDCSTIGLLQLQYVVLNIRGLENELSLIKSMLWSPLLKKILIFSNLINDGYEKFRLASKLLQFHRASPVAEIMLL